MNPQARCQWTEDFLAPEAVTWDNAGYDIVFDQPKRCKPSVNPELCKPEWDQTLHFQTRFYDSCTPIFLVTACNKELVVGLIQSNPCGGDDDDGFALNEPIKWGFNSYPTGNSLEDVKLNGLTIGEISSPSGESPFGGPWAIITATAALEDIEPGEISVVAQDSNFKTRHRTLLIAKENACSMEGDCTSTDRFAVTTSENASVKLDFFLGRRAYGKPAGRMTVHERAPTNALSTPACLKFLFTPGSYGEVITNEAGTILQIRAEQGLVNVVSNAPTEYFVEYYASEDVSSKSNNLYNVTGPPIYTNLVENPDGTGQTTNELRVTDSDGKIVEYSYTANGHWEMNVGALRKIAKPVTWFESNVVRMIKTEVRTVADDLVASTSRTYRKEDYGDLLLKEVLGEGPSSLTNEYSYYTSGTYTTGALRQVTYGTGRWEIYEQSSMRVPTTEYRSYLDAAPTTNGALCRRVEYGFGTNSVPGAGDDGGRWIREPRKVVEYVLGHEVARRYVVHGEYERRDIQSTTPGASWEDTNNLVTVTRWDTNGHYSVEQPDGMMRFHYKFVGGGYRTNLVTVGAPNAEKSAIVDGTETVTLVGVAGERVRKSVWDIASGILLSDEQYSGYDSRDRPRRVDYLDGTFHYTDRGCCGATIETNREGSQIVYDYDMLKRRVATTKNGITRSNILDAAGNVLHELRIGSDLSVVTNASYTYDTARRRLTSTDALGNVTTYSETNVDYQLIRTIVYPDATTRIEEYYRDGQLAKVTGTAVHPVRYDYGVMEVASNVWHTFTKETKLDTNGDPTSEVVTNFFDMLGRNYKTVYADAAVGEAFYNAKGQKIKEVDPDGVTTLYQYNNRGEIAYTVLDIDRDGEIDFAGTDRITQTISQVTTNAQGIEVLRRSTFRWPHAGTNASMLVSVSDSRTDGLQSWSGSFGQTNQTWISYSSNGVRYVTSLGSDGRLAVSYYLYGMLQSVSRYDADTNLVSQVMYTYDAHGRVKTTSDPRNGVTTYSYNNADQRIAVTTPPPGNGDPAQTTTYGYDYAGRLTWTVMPDGASVTNEYYPSGELKRTYGDRTYPVAYGYDAQGRMTSMTNWSGFGTGAGTRVTRWHYDNRGLMRKKIYADGTGVTNVYSPGGRLYSRTWARGITTIYATNAAGELVGWNYSDVTTSNVVYCLDRQGRKTNIVDGAGERLLTYSDSGLLLSETNLSGVLDGIEIRYGYDELNRRTNVILATPSTCVLHLCHYDRAGRLTNVSDGIFTATYSYLANSPLIHQIAFRSNGVTRMTTTKSYDYLNRLRRIQTVDAEAATIAAFDYTYNLANQRTRVTLADGSFWIYTYDQLGQVVSAKRYWSDSTPVAGQQFEYAYDDIGNRTSTRAGGDADGTGLRSAAYGSNPLNQYTNRTVPGAVDVLGASHASASVTVEDAAAYRKGEYFWKEQILNNLSGPAWNSVTTKAVYSGETNTVTGNVLLPPATETFTYDADGNLTSDGLWTNRWNAENRLVEVESLPSVPEGARKKVAFTYDSQGRRVAMVVSNYVSGNWYLHSANYFAYDKWNVLGVLRPDLTLVTSFMWGLDLSGSQQGAGGVGGLLAMNAGTNGVHFYAMDGNGNVAALVNAADEDRSAAYEYGAFGEVIRASGQMAKLNPFRFSTKHQDEITDLVYYGYRFYNPSCGRWPNRDPIGEGDASDLYGFVGNSALNRYDVLGQWGADVHYTGTLAWAFQEGISVTYSSIIAHEDLFIDNLWSCRGWMPVVGRQARHLGYDRGGDDSRTVYYNEENDRAIEHLNRGECLAAARAFGRGLHSLQDRSAHRTYPYGPSWHPTIIHPGWWDFYGDVWSLPNDPTDDLTMPHDWWWDRQNLLDFDYHSWIGHPEQRISQADAIDTVRTESIAAIARFREQVALNCRCNRLILRIP